MAYKKTEIELPIPLCQLEPSEGDPKEILMYLRTGNPICAVRLSACLISILCKKEQNKASKKGDPLLLFVTD